MAKRKPKPVPQAQTEASVANLLDDSPRVEAIPDEDLLSTGCTVLNKAFSGRACGGIPKGTYVFTVGDTGTLKAQPLDSKVLTPSGWRRMGDLKVGDALVDPDGGESVVTGVYPQGIKEIYKVEVDDGSSTLCCADHLWLTETTTEKARRGPTVKGLLAVRESIQRGIRHYLPIVFPVRFDTSEALPVPPYLLGVLLGNGFFGSPKHGSIRVSTSDREVLERVKTLIPEGHELKTRGKSWDYAIVTPRGCANFLLGAIRQMGLEGCRASDKFIPEVYLTASVEDRIELLRGLMDTDGTAFANGGSPAYSTVSKRLAADVKSLVLSLGGRVYTTSNPAPKYTYRGEVRYGQECFYLNIKVVNFNPFHLSRKAERWKSSRRDWVRRISKITPAGVAECQCISVSAPRRIYVTDDYIVTHNTFLGLNLFAEAAINRHFDGYDFVFDNAEHGALMNVPRYFGQAVADRMVPPAGTKDDPVYSETAKQFYWHLEIACRRPCIYFLDSMDALIDDAEDEVHAAEVAKYETGEGKVPGSMGMGKAKTNSRNINRVVRALRSNGSILAVIGQIRDKVNSRFPGQKTVGGGHALRFYAHFRVATSRAGDITREYMGKERTIGARVTATLEKNRVCGWEDSVEVHHLKEYGIDDIGSSVSYLTDEKHWKADKGRIYAPELDFTGTHEQVVRKIIETKNEAALARAVDEVWERVRQAVTPYRVRRYQ